MNRPPLALALTLVILVPLAHASLAAPSGYEILIGSPPLPDDRFGAAVAVEGDMLAVGVPGGALPRVEIYERAGSAWALTGFLQPDDAVGNGFGAALAISDGRLAVGWPSMREVLIYERDAGAWELGARIAPPDAHVGFGAAVALDGPWLIVGAPDRAGAAYVFEQTPHGWSLDLALTESRGWWDARTNTGRSVAIDMGRIAIGAPGWSGKVVVLERNADAWTRAVTLSGSDGGFGHAVALEGNRLVVGAPETAAGGWWEEEQVLIQAPNCNSYGLGTARHNPISRGAAHVFEHVNGSWRQTAQLVGPDGGARLGASVAIRGDTVAIGMPGSDVVDSPVEVFSTRNPTAHLFGGVPRGAVVLAERGADGWSITQTTAPDETPVAQAFGSAIALGDARLVASAPGSHGHPGSVYSVDGPPPAAAAAALPAVDVPRPPADPLPPGGPTTLCSYDEGMDVWVVMD